MNWEAISGGANALVNLGLGAWNIWEQSRQFDEQKKLMDKSLTLQKNQYDDAKKRYDTTLKNQTQAIGTLGSSFGEALQRENDKQKPQPLGSSPSTPSLLPNPQGQASEIPTQRY